MSTVKKRNNSYLITVSYGYDLKCRQLRQYMTWTPSPGMTPRQIEKELERQKVLFEEKVKNGTVTVNGNIRFQHFVEKFMNEYARTHLKAKTIDVYERHLNRICEGIGHIRLKNLKPAHIASLYSNLQENGIRAREKATFKINFAEWLEKNQITLPDFSKMCGLSSSTLRRLDAKECVNRKSATAIAACMGMPLETVFQVQRDMTPLKPGSIHAYHRTLSAVLIRAVKWGYIERNPVVYADLPSLAGRSAQYLDEPEARRLLELLQAESIKWRSIVTFDLLSGLRRGELLGLRWSDIDLDTQTLFVRQTWNYTKNKGCYVDTPKTRSSTRPLRISRTAILLLLEYKQWQDERRQLMGDAWMDTDSRVFTSDDGAPIFPDAVSQWFHKFVQRTGLPDVHIHSLRHTYASLMIADGTPLVVVSHNLGHAQSSTTANIYSHVISSAEARAAQVMDMFADLVAPKSDKNGTRTG